MHRAFSRRRIARASRVAALALVTAGMLAAGLAVGSCAATRVGTAAQTDPDFRVPLCFNHPPVGYERICRLDRLHFTVSGPCPFEASASAGTCKGDVWGYEGRDWTSSDVTLEWVAVEDGVRALTFSSPGGWNIWEMTGFLEGPNYTHFVVATAFHLKARRDVLWFTYVHGPAGGKDGPLSVELTRSAGSLSAIRLRGYLVRE